MFSEHRQALCTCYFVDSTGVLGDDSVADVGELAVLKDQEVCRPGEMVGIAGQRLKSRKPIHASKSWLPLQRLTGPHLFAARTRKAQADGSYGHCLISR